MGDQAKFFIKTKSINKLSSIKNINKNYFSNKIIKVLQLCKEYSIEYFILGNGSIFLVSDKGFDGLIINIHEDNCSDLKFEKIDETNYKVTVGGYTY